MRNNYLILFISCCMSFIACGLTSSLVSTYLPEIIKDQRLGPLSLKTNLVPWINSSFLMGMTLGGLIIGFLADSWGRINTLILSLFIAGIYTLLCPVSFNAIQLIAYRFCSGIGVSGILLISVIWVTETFSDPKKSIFQGILNFGFPVGIILSGLIHIGHISWRTAFFSGAIFIFLGILIWFKKPNSILLSSEDQTNSTAQKSTVKNFRKSILMGSILYGSVLIAVWAIISWMPLWISKISLGDLNNQTAPGQIMLVLGVGAIIGSLTSGLLSNYFGLKNVLLLTFVLCFLLTCLIFLFNKNFSRLIFVEVFVLSISMGIGQSLLGLFVSEIFPSTIRARATGICFNIGRIFTACSVFFVGSLEAILGGFGPSIVTFSSFFIIGFIVLYSLTSIKYVNH